ncbi:tyrosine-type recombinase/integrase [Streptomyces noursei]|nr:phage integrase family protein [Streptomyces noursei ATCC 11455]MCZ0995468.1 tyrosine-type recombinase/integrase [Streptomyces noursei]
MGQDLGADRAAGEQTAGGVGSPLRVPEGTTLHDLRHFFASVLIKHGATVKKVQRLLGHAEPSITWDLYVHLWEDDEDDTADIIDAVLV